MCASKPADVLQSGEDVKDIILDDGHVPMEVEELPNVHDRESDF